MEPYSLLVGQLAERAKKRVVRRTIRTLQAMKDCLLSGEDSGLTNVWDEVCVQVQDQESFYWDTYDEVVRSIVEAHLKSLDRLELVALWLDTPAGESWVDEERPAGSPSLTYCLDDLVPGVTRSVYGAAADWSNPRIQNHLARGRELDLGPLNRDVT